MVSTNEPKKRSDTWAIVLLLLFLKFQSFNILVFYLYICLGIKTITNFIVVRTDESGDVRKRLKELWHPKPTVSFIHSKHKRKLLYFELQLNQLMLIYKNCLSSVTLCQWRLTDVVTLYCFVFYSQNVAANVCKKYQIRNRMCHFKSYKILNGASPCISFHKATSSVADVFSIFDEAGKRVLFLHLLQQCSEVFN